MKLHKKRVKLVVDQRLLSLTMHYDGSLDQGALLFLDEAVYCQ